MKDCRNSRIISWPVQARCIKEILCTDLKEEEERELSGGKGGGREGSGGNLGGGMKGMEVKEEEKGWG